MNADEHHQQELEEQEWQEMLKADPASKKFFDDLNEGDERYAKRTKEETKNATC